MPESENEPSSVVSTRDVRTRTILMICAALLVGLGIWFAFLPPAEVDCHTDFGPLLRGANRTGFMKLMAAVSWGVATGLLMYAAKRTFSILIVLTLFTVAGLIWGYLTASGWTCINP